MGLFWCDEEVENPYGARLIQGGWETEGGKEGNSINVLTLQS